MLLVVVVNFDCCCGSIVVAVVAVVDKFSVAILFVKGSMASLLTNGSTLIALGATVVISAEVTAAAAVELLIVGVIMVLLVVVARVPVLMPNVCVCVIMHCVRDCVLLHNQFSLPFSSYIPVNGNDDWVLITARD